MPGPTPPAVSVIVPARDAAATLPATLAALGAQAGAPEHEVLVVDNGSRDATAALAREARARVLSLP
ncbi:MAG TPA: glycosyltransferase, partial [Solirubrobacteraceae bacterium]|nr:glycosyltransferase [Solirubrobacteraceae bacterium]